MWIFFERSLIFSLAMVIEYQFILPPNALIFAKIAIKNNIFLYVK